MLLLLEDDSDRLERFTTVIRGLDDQLPFRVWRNAHVMIREAGAYLPAAKVISLDHDLEPDIDGQDPGDGTSVVRWLVAQPVVKPVIVHTSNGERSTWMQGAFDLSGWKHYRVPPLGDDWIELDWRMTVKRILRRHSQKS